MKRGWELSLKLTAGTLFGALCAMPQGYTISARPGVINYVEGQVNFDERPLNSSAVGRTFLNAKDTLSTSDGKAEVLLTPGVYLRLGANSSIQMVSPSLTDTRLEVVSGSAMLEVNELSKESNLQIIDAGATIGITKTGLYRFTGGSTPSASVYDGKLAVQLDERKLLLKKNHLLVLNGELKADKFKAKDSNDELYAWSKTRDEYGSAASYASLRSVGAGRLADSSLGFGYDGFGPSGLGYAGLGIRPGWFWNSGFNSWAWLPGSSAFYSPFGFGFYSPSLFAYAPVVYGPVRGRPGSFPIPVNPTRHPVVGGVARPAIVTANGARFGGAQRNALVSRMPGGIPRGGGAVGAGPGGMGGPRGMGAGPRAVGGGARPMGAGPVGGAPRPMMGGRGAGGIGRR